MPQIIPIKDLKNTSAISQMCREAREPIYITKNGYGDMVIMSMEAYDRRLALADVYEKIAVAEHPIQAGELLDCDDVFAALRAKHDL